MDTGNKPFSPEEKDFAGVQTNTGVLSYRNVLTGKDLLQESESSFEGNVSDDDDEEGKGDTYPDCLVITVTKEEKARLQKPWRQSLIVKVWGRKGGYTTLLKRITS